MKKATKIIIGTTAGLVLTLALVIGIPFITLDVKTKGMKKDCEYLKADAIYSKKVEVKGINLVTQHISCGYATIEMLSTYYGKPVSEDDLSKKNGGGVSTSSTSGFLMEINASIDRDFTMQSYLSNDDYLKTIHKALSNSTPAAIEWAAKYESEWTLHFSVVGALDLGNNNITVYNPYGYIENIRIDEFLNRTSFASYENMPLFLNFGFAFGAFHKNTLFY
jgi:hypothetical protein